MKELLLINSAVDAMDCLTRERHKGRVVVTTSASAQLYLREKASVDATCLSSYFTIQEMLDINNEMSVKTDEVMALLDDRIGAGVNEANCLNLRYFWPLYANYGEIYLSSLFYILEGVRRAASEYVCGQLRYYNQSVSPFIEAKTDLKTLFTLMEDGPEAKALNGEDEVVYTHFKGFNKVNQLKAYLIGAPAEAVRKVLGHYVNLFRMRTSRKSLPRVLLHEALFDLGFLKTGLKQCSFLYYSDNFSTYPSGHKPGKSKVPFEVDPETEKQILSKFSQDRVIQRFVKDILFDFKTNIPTYLASVKHLEKILDDKNVQAAVWGGPPGKRIRALTFELLTQKGVPVVGGQHGCLYGDSVVPSHLDTDFQRCDYYLSYGFTGEDLRRVYPETEVRSKIIPCGSAVPGFVTRRRKKKIDILFPITNTLSMIGNGMIRVPPHQLMERQVKILEHLNSLQGRQIIVKPFKFSDMESCAPLIAAEKMPNLTIVNTMNLGQFLKTHAPEIVIIDLPSQPLFECLYLDAEIFLLNDPVNYYEDQALKELEKRVHYSENIKDLVTKLDLFLNHRLPGKRNSTFFDHYVFKKNREKTILDLMEGLVAGG